MSVLPDEQETSPPLSLSERAYAAIQDKLIMLEIPPMAPIDEVALVESLEVGRTPVREALKRLESDRLVISYPRRGTFATAVDITDLAYISDIRVQLEPLAARRAAEDAGDAARADLEELAEATEGLDVRSLSREELMRWDMRVHRAIYHAAGNPHLEDTLVRYDNLATRIFCLFLDRMSDFVSHVEEHAGLLRTIAAGEADVAARKARQHVQGFEKAIRAVI
ncbi:GntR family transcriptional regulator [Actinomycetospora sp. NBRC 106375]|uniref:GntR family transcriptional regulator n=1 Tax=Actinomycetospora sp. NBRC 106375 TaxID=3032207 RepID=UPI0024A2D8F8|nr:GntR family transcriptional regulator [Actinomycetospora sp. NBRC 106375]GLZ48809.1 GntR family transcriptional regulator [Actinomycetospora sp. NBRC 106375]